MKIVPLETDSRNTIWTQLSNVWDIKNKSTDVWGIGKHYWYPLTESNRNDLISFDSKYVISPIKTENLKTILRQNGIKEIYEFREDGSAFMIDSLEEYEFWNWDDYFWNNEGFWFNDDMDFIIYLSHEETITFGGKAFISEIKCCWKDWKQNLKWDTKHGQN